MGRGGPCDEAGLLARYPLHRLDRHSRESPSVIDFPNVMSKFIILGMPLSQVMASATVNAAGVFPAFDDRGTLKNDAPADVAIMELREGNSNLLTTIRAPAISGSFPSRPCSPVSGLQHAPSLSHRAIFHAG